QRQETRLTRSGLRCAAEAPHVATWPGRASSFADLRHFGFLAASRPETLNLGRPTLPSCCRQARCEKRVRGRSSVGGSAMGSAMVQRCDVALPQDDFEMVFIR